MLDVRSRIYLNKIPSSRIQDLVSSILLKMLKNIVLLAIFWAMQVAAVYFFKLGGTAPGRWVPCFLAGNAFGLTSTWLLMLIYQSMNINVALGLATGIAFMLSQIFMGVIFKSSLSPLQLAGVITTIAGVFMLSFGAK